jgi:hypothetical protein
MTTTGEVQNSGWLASIPVEIHAISPALPWEVHRIKASAFFPSLCNMWQPATRWLGFLMFLVFPYFHANAVGCWGNLCFQTCYK